MSFPPAGPGEEGAIAAIDPSGLSSSDPVAHAGACLERLRARRPRVHVLTNPVAMTVSANALLAVGAVPSMTARAEAMADFIATSEALVVNLGMLDGEREAAIARAVPLARELGRPWVLDPVKVERSGARRALARRLLDAAPQVVRANATEVTALADVGGVAHAAAELARGTGWTVAATGPVDLVTDGARTLRVANGTPLMDRATAMGCTCSALVGAFLAVEHDPFRAAGAAVLAFDVAGEVAAGRSAGPGTFVPNLLDALFALDEATLRARARLA